MTGIVLWVLGLVKVLLRLADGNNSCWRLLFGCSCDLLLDCRSVGPLEGRSSPWNSSSGNMLLLPLTAGNSQRRIFSCGRPMGISFGRILNGLLLRTPVKLQVNRSTGRLSAPLRRWICGYCGCCLSTTRNSATLLVGRSKE